MSISAPLFLWLMERKVVCLYLRRPMSSELPWTSSSLSCDGSWGTSNKWNSILQYFFLQRMKMSCLLQAAIYSAGYKVGTKSLILGWFRVPVRSLTDPCICPENLLSTVWVGWRGKLKVDSVFFCPALLPLGNGACCQVEQLPLLTLLSG